jgi:hypothetical protein
MDDVITRVRKRRRRAGSSRTAGTLEPKWYVAAQKSRNKHMKTVVPSKMT